MPMSIEKVDFFSQIPNNFKQFCQNRQKENCFYQKSGRDSCLYAGQANTTWPYWTDRQTPQNIAGNSTVTVYDEDTTYIVPGYPNAVNGERHGGLCDGL